LFCVLGVVLQTILDVYIYICHTAIENLSDPIGYLLDFTNPYNTALAGNMHDRDYTCIVS
jgi:hypothetical protein